MVMRRYPVCNYLKTAKNTELVDSRKKQDAREYTYMLLFVYKKGKIRIYNCLSTHSLFLEGHKSGLCINYTGRVL